MTSVSVAYLVPAGGVKADSLGLFHSPYAGCAALVLNPFLADSGNRVFIGVLPIKSSPVAVLIDDKLLPYR